MKQKREEVNQISWVEASQEKAIQKTKNIEKLLHDSEKTENKINKVKKEINIKKYMKQKMSEIKKFYNNQTKIIDSVSYKELKDWLENLMDVNSLEFEKNAKTLEQFCNTFNLSINNNTISNLRKTKDIVEELSERTWEHIRGIIGDDWSLHLINDIDTRHYIVPKNLMEKWDVSLFLGRAGGKISINAEKIDKLESFDPHAQKVIQVWENIPLESYFTKNMEVVNNELE